MKNSNKFLLFLCSIATLSCCAMDKRPLTPDPRAQQQKSLCTNPYCKCTPCTCNPCQCTAESSQAKPKLSTEAAQALEAARKLTADTTHSCCSKKQ